MGAPMEPSWAASTSFSCVEVIAENVGKAKEQRRRRKSAGS